MNYEDLRRYQRLERNSSKLGELRKDFYDDLYQLIAACKEKCKQSSSTEDSRVFENLVKTARDIFDRREQKILTKAMRHARTSDTDKDSLTDEENALFEKLSETIKKNRQDFELLLSGEGKPKSLKRVQNINDIPSINGEKSEDLNIVMVRTLKKVPKFVSGDLKEYGPFEANDIVKLPRKEADLLSDRNLVETI
jgi:DNA replication initiation complex subunit (GINS family)